MTTLPVSPPASERELLSRAEAIAGCRLSTLADLMRKSVPPDLRRAKGWVGTLLESVLGATAASRDAPDFEEIGVELKTLPIDCRGNPCESTFVCTVELDEIESLEWNGSRAARKLARVLWIPVQGERTIPVGQRLVGTPLLWSPTPDEERDLRADWEDLAALIGRGAIDSISGHVGRYLQIRPKARNARSRRRGTDADGLAVPVLPRGFYLRTAFTRRLLARHYALASTL